VDLTEQQREYKQKFIETRGFWNEFWDGLLRLDPNYFDAYLALSSVPWKSGPLAPKIKELIYVAVDSATTHLYAPGLRQHVQAALRLGATQAEVMEVFELTSVLGIHTCTEGVPILIEELKRAGHEFAPAFDARQVRLREEFKSSRGYWNEFWDGLLMLAPEFFEVYLKFSSVPWKSGPLEPKVKELIYIAIDASTTHLYQPGIRQHIRNALAYGATKEEIMEVFQLTSVIGIHTCTTGVPILLAEAPQNVG
jgi:alkylhydroperoxidase/carboxymuconolactone decarboxylase family protein YurZ